ncbi:hypothetical protein FB465_2690 [Kitasatospora atroaurantiaca]|uniref:Uncharacterized protein n=1 Tax=Kitasatospora atroaurantiaca TaxID=285545 RepID=A0A561EPW3_9ACTN|nr:hypothetical protein FB465_2690 [Kitasatospora atroaurantiaca]
MGLINAIGLFRGAGNWRNRKPPIPHLIRTQVALPAVTG